MRASRRYTAPIAALLVTLIAVQMLDLDLCCKARRLEADVHLPAAGSEAGAAALWAGDEGHVPHDHAAAPDCLCHLIFVSTSAAPEVLAPHPLISYAAEAAGTLCSAPLSPPAPVPIA
jgi:hypothetical protein